MSGELKIGLFGIGLEAYWPQFEGLKERLLGYLKKVEQALLRSGVHIVNVGLVDSPEQAFNAGHQFRREDVDLIFLYVTTYALSSTVLPVLRRAKAPVLVLNLSPQAAIDYDALNRLGDRTKMTAEWLAYCQACPVPEIANVFARCGIPFFQVTGTLENSWAEIGEWVEAAKVARVMEHNRMGVMGHYYGGMLDIYSDLTLHCSTFGGHIEMIEVEELACLRRDVSADDVNARVQVIRAEMDVQPDCPQEELERAARTSVALDWMIERRQLGSLAYYYQGTGNPENQEAISSIIVGASLLTARGVPIAGEYEIKNAQAMKIMSSFRAGGSFTEYYAVDYNDDVVLMGHDGPGHIAIAHGKTRVKPLQVYHGKVGRGLSVEMSVKHGPVTLLSVVEIGGKIKLLMAEGEAVPGPILAVGNTNSRYRFPVGAKEFITRWNSHSPAHHCAVGIGHIASKLNKFGSLLGIECTLVC
ncbi:MAG TPA: arabinose isomerase [Terriglobales bacterium]|nr:arabinose isomerase [Terriglobales bacterium]